SARQRARFIRCRAMVRLSMIFSLSSESCFLLLYACTSFENLTRRRDLRYFVVMQTDGGVTVTLEGISKVYPNGFQALRDIHLGVEAGEWLVLVGPSGCGKTTTLRIIAGLEEPSGGTVRIAGQSVNSIAPWKRNVAMVFQRPALAPTHTVQQ